MFLFGDYFMRWMVLWDFNISTIKRAWINRYARIKDIVRKLVINNTKIFSLVLIFLLRKLLIVIIIEKKKFIYILKLAMK